MNTDEITCPTCGRDDFKNNLGMRRHHARMHGESLSQYEYECIQCGKEKSVPQSWVRKRDTEPKYCSKECRLKDERHELVCAAPDCDTEFTRPAHIDTRFCSIDCAYGNRDKVDESSQTEIKCGYCSESFRVQPSKKSRRRFCSLKCKADWQRENLNGENHPSWEGGHEGWYRGNWPKQREKARDRDDNECQVCGRGKKELGRNPDVHHKIPYAKFEDPEKAHQLDNLVTLCREHHDLAERWNLVPMNVISQ